MKLTNSAGRSAGPGPRTTLPAPPASPRAEDGFSLVEVIVAMMVLVVGLLGLAQVFYLGLSAVGGSSAAVVAREKAREAIESVHSARDTRVITWAQIRNANAPANCPAGTNPVGGGIFRNNAVNLGAPGPDGLVNTQDDTAFEVAPGKDNIMGTSDDVRLQGFTREIAICDVPNNTNLRMIVVTIRYNTGSPKQQVYSLTSYVSRFS